MWLWPSIFFAAIFWWFDAAAILSSPKYARLLAESLIISLVISLGVGSFSLLFALIQIIHVRGIKALASHILPASCSILSALTEQISTGLLGVAIHPACVGIECLLSLIHSISGAILESACQMDLLSVLFTGNQLVYLIESVALCLLIKGLSGNWRCKLHIALSNYFVSSRRTIRQFVS